MTDLAGAWHPSAGPRQDRDLFGPYWAEVWPRRLHSMPMEGADPGAWGWGIYRFASRTADKRVTVAEGFAPGPAEAKQAVGDYLAARPALGSDWVLWNAVVPVVALLRAPDGASARDRLAQALRAAGFDVYDDPGADVVNVQPIQAEDQAGGESDPPPDGWPWPDPRPEP
jgi:hypothetical protein